MLLCLKAYNAYTSNLFANVIKWTQYRKVLENGASMSFDTSAYGPEGIKSIIIKDSGIYWYIRWTKIL